MQRWLGLVVIAVLVGGVLLAKQMRATSTEPVTSAAAPADVQPARTQVLLFADPREAEASCGCGQIFQLVRAASERGVSTREINPAHDRELVQQYRVTVEPTVVFVDSDGTELSRHEGESSEIITALRGELDELAGEQR